MTKPDRALFDRIRRGVLQDGLLIRGSRVLAACSGGPDSVFLLHALLSLRQEWELDLQVGHFDHRLRPGSVAEAAFVRDLAARLSLPFHSGSDDVAAHAERRRMNLEEAARELRYDFLLRSAAGIGAARVATGHTLTDQAETVLMRLLRGSGPRGLTGIHPRVGEVLIRPLLGITRGEIETYLDDRDIEYRIDPSNRDRRFLRNRIRHELLPLLENEYARGAASALARLAGILREEDAWMEERALAAAPEYIREDESGIYLELDAMSGLPRALRRRLMRLFFARLRKDLREISFEDVEAALRLGRGKRFRLKGGIPLRNRGGRLVAEPPPARILSYRYAWDGERALELPEAGLILRGGRAATDVSIPGGLDFDDERFAFLDAERLRFPLSVRSRREGDRYRPLGAPGRGKLKEILRAHGIPLDERDRRPVILSGDEIVWMVGLPVSEEFKLRAATRAVFRIDALPRSP